MNESSPGINPANPLGLKRLAKDSMINFLRQGYSILFALIISILLARGLGKEARGIYALCLLVPEILITFLNLGINVSSVYFISRQEFPAEYVVRQNASLANWISILAIGLGYVTIILIGPWAFPEIPRNYLLLSLLIVPVNLHVNVMTSIFQGLQDFRSYNIPGMLNQAVMLGMVLLLIWVFKIGVVGAILSYLFGALISLVSLIILVRFKIGNNFLIPFLPDGNYIRHIIRYGILAHLSNLLGFLSYRIDNFILMKVTGPAAVGIYAIAVSLGERLWLPTNAISSALFPRIASLYEEGEKQNTITPIVARIVFWLTLPLAFGFGFISYWLIPLIYGQEFAPSVYPFLGILPGIIMLNIGKIISNDLAGRGKVGLNLVITGIGFVVNLISNFTLIPRFGPLGAAVSSTISYSLVTCISLINYCRITSSPWRKVLLLQKTDLQLIKQTTSLILTRFGFTNS